jgi:hypothetical protein
MPVVPDIQVSFMLAFLFCFSRFGLYFALM